MAHQSYPSCVAACNACADACDHCSTACLQEGEVNKLTRCIALDMDCAAICRLAASFVSRDSGFAKQLCKLCAEICQACGDECAKHAMGHCQDCAKACHRCAQECTGMAGA